jgi:hypothetical protein
MTVIDLIHSRLYEDDECSVRVTDKSGEPLTNANAFFFLTKAILDIILPDEED